MLWIIYFLIIINIIVFGLMGLDKRRAIKNKTRIKEQTFCILSMFGGFVGLILGMMVFKHKTNKLSFYLIVLVSFIVWIAILISIQYLINLF